jgi:hypothetical protein
MILFSLVKGISVDMVFTLVKGNFVLSHANGVHFVKFVYCVFYVQTLHAPRCQKIDLFRFL